MSTIHELGDALRARRTEMGLSQARVAALSGLCMLGGEAAAGRLTQHLRPGTITVYGAKVEPRFLVDHKLRKDADGEIEILKRFWRFDEEERLAPVPLIYADLIQKNDARCLEAAQILHDRFIAGFEHKG